MRRVLSVALLALLVAGCAGSREVRYKDPRVDFNLIQTAAVLPFANLTQTSPAAERVRDVFMTMLQATGATYVLPPGEVARGISRMNLRTPQTPSPEEVSGLCTLLNADVVITGTVREYGEVRSAGTSANVVAVSLQMIEGETGTIIWSGSTTQGGIRAKDRLFGGGGRPMDEVTRRAVRDLLDQMFAK
jgi:polysaccharide biosynthesis protein PelC